jgi:DNA-binding transcriptional LysR family regulator
LDARQLRYFLSVVDHGSVRRAAEELFVAQPSISQALRTLERDLGTMLFHRTGRRLVLTPSGELLVEPARQVMRWLDVARSRVAATDGLAAGRLVIAAMPSQSVAPLTPLISRFVGRYPLVQVSVLAAATPPDITTLLRTGDVELGLVADQARMPPPDECVRIPLETQRFIIVAASEADLPDSDPVRLEDLAGHRLIIGQPGTGMRRVADAILARAAGSRAVVEIEHREAVLPLVLARIGSAVLSEAWRPMAEAAGAAARDLLSEQSLSVSLVHRAGPLSPAATAFLALAVRQDGHRDDPGDGTDRPRLSPVKEAGLGHAGTR